MQNGSTIKVHKTSMQKEYNNVLEEEKGFDKK